MSKNSYSVLEGVENSKKTHAATTPVGEGMREEVRKIGTTKVVQKVGILCGRGRNKSTKTCSENARRGGREGGLDSARPAPSSPHPGCQAASAREPGKSPVSPGSPVSRGSPVSPGSPGSPGEAGEPVWGTRPVEFT